MYYSKTKLNLNYIFFILIIVCHKPSLILNVIICYKIFKGFSLSVKDDLKAIKEELNTEEQFLEGMIRAERFYKRYKKPIWFITIIVIILFVGYSVKTYINENNLKIANIAYLKLMQNPNNKQALKTLKNKNIKLYYAYEFHLAAKTNNKQLLKEVTKQSNDKILKDLAQYQLASIDKNQKELETYVNNSKIGLLRNMALLEDAFLLLKNNKIDQAKIKLSLIEVDSPLNNIAKNLEHFSK